MAAKPVVRGLWQVGLGMVNAFLFDTGEGLALIDSGLPGSSPRILEAVRAIGREPADIRRILVTHCHADHSGSLAEMKRRTGASAAMHPADAALVRLGRPIRPFVQTPGLVNAMICRVIAGSVPTEVEPAEVEHELVDGARLPGGLRAIHVPGHCAGQLAFLWEEHGGVLIAADVAVHVLGLAPSPLYEDPAEGERSLSKLSKLEFEVACFGHGRPIRSGAAERFRRRWPAIR